MAKIKTKRERVKFASDNVAGACPEVLEAIIKANEGDSTPYGNDPLSTELQDKFSEIFEKEVIVLENNLLARLHGIHLLYNNEVLHQMHKHLLIQQELLPFLIYLIAQLDKFHFSQHKLF